MVDLLTEGVQKGLVAGQGFRFARVQAYLFAGTGVKTIVQGNFQYFGQVEVTSQNVAFGTEGSGFHATAAAPVTGVFQALPLVE